MVKNYSSFFWLFASIIIMISCGEDPIVIDDPIVITDPNTAPTDAQSIDIPVIMISTNGSTIVDEPKIAADMTIKMGETELMSSKIGIEFRGSSSQTFPKKSYGLETWDENGDDVNVSIFDFPEEEDWILYGPYSDKTFMRNVLSYELSNQMNLYAVKTKFVELEINGSYEGVYVFMEKIKRDKNRVDIKKLESDDTDGDKITGGYILKIDKSTGDNTTQQGDYSSVISFRSKYDTDGEILNNSPFQGKRSEETYFIYEYPKYDDITDQQKDYIKGYIDSFEISLVQEDFSTNERDYSDYIDVASFVDFFIVNELGHNPDAYRLSTFLSKNRGEKLKMGPVWDFNIAFGNDSDSYRNSSDTWIYQYNDYLPNDLWLVPFWWEKLLDDPMFRAQVKSRWNQLRGTTLSLNNIETLMNSSLELVEKSHARYRNYERWKVLGEKLPFNGFVGENYEAEVEFFRKWISDRLDWMDGQIANW